MSTIIRSVIAGGCLVSCTAALCALPRICRGADGLQVLTVVAALLTLCVEAAGLLAGQ